jgi:hypothetical protein
VLQRSRATADIDHVRICLCIAEDDLRTWVMEELLLMTWVMEQPTFVTTTELGTINIAGMSLVIVDTDRLPRVPLAVPIIAIGPDPGIPGIQALSAKLTSRELKQAIRVAL